MKTILAFVLSISFFSSLSAQTQDKQTIEAWSALQQDFAKLSNIDIKYSSTKTNSSIKEVYTSELKVRNDCFWFSQKVADDQLDPSKNLSVQVAYDGKLFQILHGDGGLIIESTPNLSNIQVLGSTPLIRRFAFVHLHPDWHTINAFTFLSTPENWRILANDVSVTKREKVDGVDILELAVKSPDGEYQVKLRPDLNYLPIGWKTVNGVGFPVTYQGSSFQQFKINGSTITFPTRLIDTLSKPDGTTVQSTETTIISISPLTTALSNNSEFQINRAFAASILDEDTHKYIKARGMP